MPELTFDQLAVQLIRTHPEDYWSRGDVLLDLFAGVFRGQVLRPDRYPTLRWEWGPDGRPACRVARGRYAFYGSEAAVRPVQSAAEAHWPVLDSYLTCPDPAFESLESLLPAALGARNVTTQADREAYTRRTLGWYPSMRHLYETRVAALHRIRDEAEKRARRDLRLHAHLDYLPSHDRRLDTDPIRYRNLLVPGPYALAWRVPQNVEPSYLDAAVQALDLLARLGGDPDTERAYIDLHHRFPDQVPPRTPERALFFAGRRLLMHTHGNGLYQKVGHALYPGYAAEPRSPVSAGFFWRP